jgi:hypothetical protein
MTRVESNEQAHYDEMEKKLESMEKKIKHSNRRFFSCFNCLLYFLAIILIGCIFVAYGVARSGMVRVPYLSDHYFSQPKPSHFVIAAAASDPNQALFEKLKLGASQQFAQGQEVAIVPVVYSEALLTKLLADYMNKGGQSYEQAQIAVVDQGLELFLHKTDSNTYITAIIVPEVKNQEIKFQLQELRLGALSLPTSIGNLILKWFFAQPLNAVNALIKDFGSIRDISFNQGEVVITFMVTKNSKILNAF